MFDSLWRNRELIKASAKREVLWRYRGSVMGIWVILQSTVNAHGLRHHFERCISSVLGGGNGSKTEFAFVLFAGLLMFNLFAECINQSPSLILSNVNYAKNVVFPLEILPAVTLLFTMFHALISLGVWFLVCGLFLAYRMRQSYFYIHHGVELGLAPLGVYLRDVSQIIGVITSVLMFMNHIFYSVSALPENYRHLLYLNPLTPVIEMTHDVLYWA